MIAAKLRGGSKPSLNEALGWIGWRVDDIYGAGVGRLDDVWIDPGSGSPRWLLVEEGRFGGRSTLIPFEDATAGAGHVWVPYERDVVRAAPEVQAGTPLTQEIETALRAHYSASAPRSASRPAAPRGQAGGATTIRFGRAGQSPEGFAGRPADATSAGREPPVTQEPPAVPYSEPPPPQMPERPAPPVEAPLPAREEPTPPPLDYAARPRPARTPEPEPEAVRYRRDEELVYRPPPEGRDPYRYAPPETDPTRIATRRHTSPTPPRRPPARAIRRRSTSTPCATSPPAAGPISSRSSSAASCRSAASSARSA